MLQALNICSASFEPRAAAESFFPGTLETSMCATRLFPTADYPERSSLRLPAYQLCNSTVVASREYLWHQQIRSSGIKLLREFTRSPASVGGGGLFRRPRLSGTTEERPGMARAFVGTRPHHPRAAANQASHRNKSISARAALEMKSGTEHA